MERLAIKVKKILDKSIVLYKRINWERKLKKVIKSEDKNYLNNEQVKESKQYWSKYTNKANLDFIKYYSSRTGLYSKYYIPDNLYYSYIDMHFNNSKMSYGIDDKSYYDKLFPNLITPNTVIRKINGFFYDHDYKLIRCEDIEKIIKKNQQYVFKPSIDSQGGAGIIFFENSDLQQLQKVFNKHKNFIIQEEVTQHEKLKLLNPTSLNTIRVISLFSKGKIHILSSILRIGISGSRVDNASSGGIVVGIDNLGCLKEHAYSSKERVVYKEHPDSGIVFKKYKVPKFEDIIKIIKKESLNFPHFRLISWDFAINESGEVVFIEFNLKNGQLDIHQLTNGPLFGDLTDDILEEVFLD